jgi:fibronectin type 3 domain-containing protein
VRQRFWAVVLILSICTLSLNLWASASFRLASAQPATLAETLNSVINNVNWTYGNSWTSNWAMILAGIDESAFDKAIAADIDRGDFIDAMYVARLAELDGYHSEAILNATQTALQQIVMCGSLPITADAKTYGDPDLNNSGCYLVYHRFGLWGYRYAEELGLVDKWNVTQAFSDFAKAYNSPPTGSVSGEMLWCDPQENWARSYSSRYYDEHAETLSVFLKFAEQDVPNAIDYADRAWSGVQAHWNVQDGYYGYTSTTIVECEMGNFAQIISEYKALKGGTIQYWDRVIQDLNYKLLASGWSSPGWGAPGVIRHAQTNQQLRLWETMGALIALQGLFPDFTPAMKSAWADMLMGSNPAWQGLMGSSLNVDGYFRGLSNTLPSNDATACAAATLFLYGIVPVTGNLAIPSREEFYNDLRTPFVPSDFMFDYENRRIRIPLNAGEIRFVYGSLPVSYNFTSDGVYDIEFTSDWNQIKRVNGHNVALTPAEPQELVAAEGTASISLSWSPPLSNGGTIVTNYRLYKGNASGAEGFFKEVENVLSFVDTEVTYGETYYYRITAINSFGESEFSNETSTTLSSPMTTDDYDGLWHTSDFSINLNATDPSGVSETYYKLNGGQVQNVSMDGQPQITSEGGNGTLEYWSVDSVGNEEFHRMLMDLKLDKTAPVLSESLSGTQGSNDWYTSAVQVTLTGSDSGGSGLASVEYSLDGGTWIAYTNPFTMEAQGTTTLDHRITDNAGNVYELPSRQIKVDTVAPVGSILINGGATSTTSTSVTLTLTYADHTSGVSQVRYSNDALWDTEAWESPSGTKVWTLTSGEGTKTVYYQIRDNAGLLFSIYSDTISLQSPSPSPSPSPSSSPSPSPAPTLTPTPSQQSTQSPTPQQEEQSLFLYEIAVVVAFALIGAAIIMLKKRS